MARETKSNLAKLMDKLEAKSIDGYSRMSFPAKAVGKSKEHIHLAVETGIVSVPLTEIESVRPIPGRGDLEMIVEVRNGNRIEFLRPYPGVIRYPVPPGTLPDLPPLTWPPRVPPGGYPNVGQDGGTSTKTSECSGSDTSTTSAGMPGEQPQPDQTDDYRQHCWHYVDD